MGLPGGPVVEGSPASAGDTGFDPRPGRVPYASGLLGLAHHSY